MNLQRIDDLIVKYENGESSLAEEQELREFFLNDESPEELREYRDILRAMENFHSVRITNPEFDEKVLDAIAARTDNPSLHFRYSKPFVFTGIAAALILIFGLYFILKQTKTAEDTYSDPAIAYAETRRVLLLVSENLNAGHREMAKLSHLNQGLEELNNLAAFDEGMKNLKKFAVLEQSKQTITSKNK
jgi:hypothetical protein